MPLAELFQNLAEHYDLPASFTEGIDLLLPISFNESGLKIKEALETVYTDGITGLEDVSIDGDTVSGVFLDKILPTLTKRYTFKITPSNIIYKLDNPDDLDDADFAELEFATATKKEKKCVKGTPCGGSCISKDRACRKTPPPQAKEAIAEVIAKGKKAPSKSKKNATAEVKAESSKRSSKSAKQETELGETLDSVIANSKKTYDETQKAIKTKADWYDGDFGGIPDRLGANIDELQKIKSGKGTDLSLNKFTDLFFLHTDTDSRWSAGKPMGFGGKTLHPKMADLANRVVDAIHEGSAAIYQSLPDKQKDDWAREAMEGGKSAKQVSEMGKSRALKAIYKDLADRALKQIEEGTIPDRWQESSKSKQQKPSKKPKKQPDPVDDDFDALADLLG